MRSVKGKVFLVEEKETCNVADIKDEVANVEVEAPFGLPPVMAYEEYLEDLVYQLRWFNYKVTAQIGHNRNILTPMLTVIDTGAGPYLISEGAGSEETLRNIDTSKKIANLRGASCHKLHTLGIVTLAVKVGNKISRCLLVVVLNLEADALLGCSYTDLFVEAIMCIKLHIVLEDGDVVPIQRRRALVPIIEAQKERPEVGSRAYNAVNAVRTAERIKILALFE